MRDLSESSFDRVKGAWIRTTKQIGRAIRASTDAPTAMKKAYAKFEAALELSADAFMEWRYGESAPRGWFLDGVPNELREMILELRPDLRTSNGPRTILDP
jgi:hypothetical protein